MAVKLFPIQIPVSEQTYEGLRKYFRSVRPERTWGINCWYAVGYEILAQDRVTFVVHDIEDNTYGGVGKWLYSFSVRDPKLVLLTQRIIDNRILQMAIEKRQEELHLLEEQIIMGIVGDLVREFVEDGVLKAEPKEEES